MTPEEYESAMKRSGRIAGRIVSFAAASVQAPANKFGAKPTVVDGQRCDSKKEAAHFLLLRDRQAKGEIRNLVLHGRVELEVRGFPICLFEPDFLFEAPAVNGDGKWRLHAEDVKGYKRGGAYELFKVKARLFEAIHGTKVVEI